MKEFKDKGSTSSNEVGTKVSTTEGPTVTNSVSHSIASVQFKKNNTGLPDNIKSGIENLSGHSLDDVKVHYNSSKPKQFQAHAYTQGTDIHVGSGQEKHLAHEAWHVVQQKQGRVKPTTQMNGAGVNDHPGLEKEADAMGAKALQMKFSGEAHNKGATVPKADSPVIQSKSMPNHFFGTIQLHSSDPIQLVARNNFTSEQRRKMLARDKAKHGFHTCAHCGFQHSLATYATYRGRALGDGSFHIDHVVPASQGGLALARNGRVLCGTCNTSRGAGRAIKTTGISKFSGIHRGGVLKNYSRLRSSRRRRR